MIFDALVLAVSLVLIYQMFYVLFDGLDKAIRRFNAITDS